MVARACAIGQVGRKASLAFYERITKIMLRRTNEVIAKVHACACRL